MKGSKKYVSRLDGPDSETVQRIINDSLEAERKGLKGTALLDWRYTLAEAYALAKSFWS